jgi:hypothetical protein
MKGINNPAEIGKRIIIVQPRIRYSWFFFNKKYEESLNPFVICLFL